MLKIAACLTEQHDFRLVLLAVAVCLLGCYTALSLLARARSNGPKWLWLGASAAVAGASVWATHFVAMLAYRPGFLLGYDIALTAFSIAIAIIMIWIAFSVAVRWRAPIAGGIVFGLAVGAMHFTGMAALSVQADFVWDIPYVAVSLASGALLGATGFRLFARGNDALWRIAATAALSVGIAILHFTAMTALTLVPDPTVALSSGAQIAPQWLPIIIACLMMFIAILGLGGSGFDQHLAERALMEATRLRAYVSELEETKRVLQRTTENLGQALDGAAAASQAKSQFLAAMSYELRTPLNAIIGFSELIELEIYGPLGDHRYREYVQDVRDSGRHLLNLVNDILDFSKVDAGRLELHEEVLDVTETVQTAMRIVEGQAASARVRLVTDLPACLPRLRADERRVRQVLLNLLSNAIKFTPDGGEVRVSALEFENRLSICVSDTGIGIAAEDIPRALERFGQVDSRLSRNYEGAGLGLPLSKRLMEAHGGTLALESAPRVGTKVTVTFPADRVIENQVAA